MNVLLINKSDSTGGAAVVSFRLMQALNAAGVDTRMLVAEKLTDSPEVSTAASPAALKRRFLLERLSIFLADGFDRKNLFKIDTAECGVDLSRHPWVEWADVICLNWINQGLLSLKDIDRICALGKPVVWTMHDMWNLTGVCHHAGSCTRWLDRCGYCPLLGRMAREHDASRSTWLRKSELYTNRPIAFVAVSNWLADLSRRSTLMSQCDLHVIPNAFPLGEPIPEGERADRGLYRKLLFGAARLDDPIKGLPLLKESLAVLARDYPDVAARCELITFGSVKDASALSGFSIAHRHLGRLSAPEVKAAYADADIVLSTSQYETLPGTLVEGMAWGCVPVATSAGGQNDIVNHRLTGWLTGSESLATGKMIPQSYDIPQGIVWADRELQKNGARLRALMYESVKNRFSAGAVANRYIALFNRLLGR